MFCSEEHGSFFQIRCLWNVDSGMAGGQLALMSELEKSPLDALHREAGGRIEPFAGREMPMQYQSIGEEHKVVREAVGQFDISHLGQLFVEGELAEQWLNGLLTNDVATLEDGQGHYTFLLNEQGGVIDDLFLYRMAEGKYFLVVNAAFLKQDLAWLGKHAMEEITLRDASEGLAGIAVQGPDSIELFSRVFGGRCLPSRHGIDVLEIEGQQVRICRTGYTGEDGFEFFCTAGAAERWWEEFAEAGAKPCGLLARDALRLEKCYPLNGSDLCSERTPLEAGLGHFVKLDKGDFVGSEVLKKQKEERPAESLVPILCDEKGPSPHPGCVVSNSEGEKMGTLTSGAFSPTLGVGIGMAYLPFDMTKVGSAVFIELHGKKMAAKVVKKPFVV